MIILTKSTSFAVPEIFTWWRHKMETFSALLALCAGNSPITGEFLAQRPVTWSFGVYFDLFLNKWLSKQSWGWWFETPSRPLWRHCNELKTSSPISGENYGITVSLWDKCRNGTLNAGSVVKLKQCVTFLLQWFSGDPEVVTSSQTEWREGHMADVG